MNLNNMFGTSEKNKKRSHLKNLVAIAKLDGVITDDEYKFLLNVGKKVGVSESEIKKMIEKTSNIEITKPETVEIALDYIYDLVLMTMADGVVDEKEIDLTIEIAEKMGLDPKTSAIIVRKIFMLAETKHTKEFILDTLKSHLLF